jgi:tRNA modification GTPase
MTVLNKSDLLPKGQLVHFIEDHFPSQPPVIAVSSRTGRGLSDLLEAIRTKAERYYEGNSANSLGDASPVRLELLQRFQRLMRTARVPLSNGQFLESLHGLEQVRREWEDLFGVVSHQEVYDRVFSTFCIGK